VRSNNEEPDIWEQRVAKKYYDRLFKEYAICELKYYKEGKIALRWRVEREVVSGKGQFICASTSCESTTSLKSWEVNFGYVEDGEKKNELVKVRLCPECSDKLNYKTKKRAAKRKEKKQKRRRKGREDKDDKDVSTEESSNSEADGNYYHVAFIVFINKYFRRRKRERRGLSYLE
jgi:protein FRA10AC1